MFANIVKNQYIGKSKLIIVQNEKVVPPQTLMGDISLPIIKKNKYQPDLVIIGSYHKGIINLTPDVLEKMNLVKLVVTGIPKRVPLDDYKLPFVIWESYYEDDHRGLLFQIIPNDKPLEFIKNTLNRS